MSARARLIQLSRDREAERLADLDAGSTEAGIVRMQGAFQRAGYEMTPEWCCALVEQRTD